MRRTLAGFGGVLSLLIALGANASDAGATTAPAPPSWQRPLAVPGSGRYLEPTRRRLIALAPDGRATIAWVSCGRGSACKPVVWFASIGADGKPGSRFLLSRGAGVTGVTVATDRSGGMVAAWQQQGTDGSNLLWVAFGRAGAGFEYPSVIGPVDAGEYALAAGHAGEAAITWANGRQVYVARAQGNAFGSAQPLGQLAPAPDTRTEPSPDLSVSFGPRSELLVAWVDRTVGATSTISAALTDAAGAFGAPTALAVSDTTLLPAGTGVAFSGPQTAIDGDGVAFIAWDAKTVPGTPGTAGDDRLYVARLSPGGIVSGPTPYPAAPNGNSLTVDGDGRAELLWGAETPLPHSGARLLWARDRHDVSGLTRPVSVVSGAWDPVLSAEAGRPLTAIWEQAAGLYGATARSAKGFCSLPISGSHPSPFTVADVAVNRAGTALAMWGDSHGLHFSSGLETLSGPRLAVVAGPDMLALDRAGRLRRPRLPIVRLRLSASARLTTALERKVGSTFRVVAKATASLPGGTEALAAGDVVGHHRLRLGHYRLRLVAQDCEARRSPTASVALFAASSASGR